MSFKRVAPKAKTSVAQETEPAVPGPLPAELLNSVGSEVSRESAPLLEFLVRNARKIVLGLVILVLLLAGYGGYRWHEEREYAAGMRDLGRILTERASPAQLQKLLAFAEQGPSKTSTAAYFEAARIATQLGDKAMAGAAWAHVAKTGGALGLAAELSRAQTLVASGEIEEAARLYQSLKPEAKADADLEKMLLSYTALAWTQAAFQTEGPAADAARAEAVAIYETLIPTMTPQEKPLFEYCLARTKE